MTKQYWVGSYYVDLSRNLIRQQEALHKLPPKALLVLTHLAENPAQVVSYGELLDTVWHNSVVTPNTLQRSITQLRKALNDDSQEIIKTHSKQGYSLELAVTWETPATAKRPTTTVVGAVTAKLDANSEPQRPWSPLVLGSLFTIATAIVTAIAVLIIGINHQHNSGTFTQGELRYITATDDKEFDPSWSPDGEYILFHRYPEKLCINRLWAKHRETQQEFQLTQQLGTYVQHSLSPDSEKLVYIKRENCQQPIDQNICYRLMSLDFQQALMEPQAGTELLSCEHSAIKKPVWIDAEHIVLMQRDAHSWRLVRYSFAEATISPLYQVANGTVQAYSWSAEKQQFAVASVKANGEYYIDMLTAAGELLSSQPVQLTAENLKFMRLNPTFVPASEQLLFTDRRSIYSLFSDGRVQRQNFNFDHNIGTPVFHPSGERMLLVKGRYDSDIARISVADTQAESIQQRGRLHHFSNTQFEVLERSTTHEDNAKFQPGGEHIAFISQRTGNEQLWLTKLDSQPKMLSRLPVGSYVRNIEWDPRGTSVMVLANSELYQVNVAGEQHKYQSEYPVLDLFYWDQNSQQVIANIEVGGRRKFVEIDLSTMKYQLINNKWVNWAVKIPVSPLIFIDHLNRFWQKTELENRLIPQLNNQTKPKARFVMQQHTIYGINQSQQLWSYNLQTQQLSILGKAPPHSDYLTDASAETLLLTLVVAAKKEVVELELGEER